MKPKRTILLFHEDPACMTLVLKTWGHLVLPCGVLGSTAALLIPQALAAAQGIDLVLIGPHISFDELSCDLPLVRMADYADQAHLRERIRIALVRKRGPKRKELRA